MHIQEILQLVDEAIYFKTGNHLNDLQRGIIEGTLKRQKYSEIAEQYDCTPGHAKDIGYELLQMLSDVFGESVHKGNLKSVLERQANLNISFGDRNINSHIIGCINLGDEQSIATPNKSQPVTSNLQQPSQNQSILETIDKLRQFGLNDEQIAEALKLPLEVVKHLGE
nr:hypothetical protein [Gloeotrichia echinulata DEX184]